MKFITDRQNFVEKALPSDEVKAAWKGYFEMVVNKEEVEDGLLLALHHKEVDFNILDEGISLEELDWAIRHTDPSRPRQGVWTNEFRGY